MKSSKGLQHTDELPVPDAEGVGIQIGKLGIIVIFVLELFASWKKVAKKLSHTFADFTELGGGKKKNQCPEPGKIRIL